MIKRIAKRLRLNEMGVILPVLMIFMVAFTVIGLSLLSFTTSQYTRTRNNVYIANATQVAEAGIEQTLSQINQDEGFAGYGSDQEFFNDVTQGRGAFTTTITPTPDSNAKIITATGKVYRANSGDPVSTRKIRVTIVGTNSQGYSVHTGPGGLILGGSANITNSDVYVNGTITMTGAAKIGTNAQPVEVFAANYACPTGATPGPTYPSLCTTTQPISLQQSTFIYGTVCATGQTSYGPNPSKNIQPGSSGQGLVLGCTAPQVTPPTYDKAAHMAAVTTTASGTSNTYVCNSWPFNRTWPANLRLTGNVNVDGSCEVLLTGNVHITGNLNLGGASRITVADSLGTTRPVIIVDGTITVGGSARIIANSSGTGAHFISFRSSGSCNPNCTSLTGTDLKTSQNTTTVNLGGAVNLPGMIFQAYWGKLVLGGSGNVGAALGQTIDMSGAGTVTFGTILSSGSRSWTVTSYQEIFD